MTDRIRKIEIRKLTSADHDQVTALAAKVSEHDLLFLARDLTHPKVIEAWMTEIGEGSIHSLAAFLDGKLVGYTALLTDPHSWSSHVGEIRVLVDSSCRGQGVGASLLIKTFQHALSLGC